MEAGINTGPIVYQSLFDIGDADTALTLYAKCTKEGVALLLRLLETATEMRKRFRCYIKIWPSGNTSAKKRLKKGV